MRKRTQDILIELGVPADIKGFHYICDAMEIYEEDESYIASKRCALYEKIAQKYETKSTRVERAIRHAMLKAVTYGNLDSLNKYMSAAQKFTVGNFLACLYLKIKEEK